MRVESRFGRRNVAAFQSYKQARQRHPCSLILTEYAHNDIRRRDCCPICHFVERFPCHRHPRAVQATRRQEIRLSSREPKFIQAALPGRLALDNPAVFGQLQQAWLPPAHNDRLGRCKLRARATRAFLNREHHAPPFRPSLRHCPPPPHLGRYISFLRVLLLVMLPRNWAGVRLVGATPQMQRRKAMQLNRRRRSAPLVRPPRKLMTAYTLLAMLKWEAAVRCSGQARVPAVIVACPTWILRSAA